MWKLWFIVYGLHMLTIINNNAFLNGDKVIKPWIDPWIRDPIAL